MLRRLMFGFVALAGLLNVASAATISAVLKPTFLDGQQNPTFTGYYQQTVPGLGTFQDYIGQITAPNAENIVVKEDVVFGQGRVAVRTDLTQQTSTNNKLFKLTTYAWFQYDTNPPSLTSETYYVQNKAYLEFTINGNYDWNIQGSDPLASSSTNRRYFEFVKVVNGVEQAPPIASNSSGTGVSNVSSSTEIGSGTYRLYYDHRDTNKYTQAANATNLDILFTFKSEDNGGGGGGGVVPEPSSVAVFGLLSLGGAVAKWRRKKSLQAA